MIKKTLLLSLSLFVFVNVKAQKGANGIQIGARAAFPTEKLNKIANTGFGATVKGIYGIGNNNSPHQVTLEAGYNRFGLKDLPSDASGHYAAIPIYTGYRYTLGKIIVDTQAGISINRVAGSSAAGVKANGSQTAFGWAVGAGYLLNNIELGLKYQSSDLKDELYDIKFFALRVGYNFAL